MKLVRKIAISTLTFAFSPLLFSAPHVGVQDPELADYNIPRINQPIKIDAHLDEAAWNNAQVIDINNITWPEENIPSPVSTTALIMEDGKTLYVAFKAMDPNPEKIKAFLTDRDKNWGHDRVAIKIDPYHDHSLAYQFFINPLGTQADAIENELTKRESDAWDAIWDSAGRITDEGYIVEVAIPLRVLNFNEELDIQHWGMEFVRFYPRDKQTRISNTKIDQNNPCWICQMSVVSGFKGAKQGKNFAIVPTLVSGVSESRDPESTLDWESDSNTDVGVDLKWGITPDVTLNATFNPDFSQVEADSGQLDVNNTFALFLREKRSFFLENQDYFSTPVNLIYTRNINDPDYGAKLTGKMGVHSVAAFVANDQSTSMLLPGNLGSSTLELDEKSTNTALRYRYSYNKQLAFGATSTTRQSDSYHNYVTSFDSKYQPTPNDTFNFQYMHSDTEFSADALYDIQHDDDGNFDFYEQSLRSQTVNGTDRAYQISYRHDNRDWFFRARRDDIGADFRADLAFFGNTDKVKNVLGGGYKWRGDENTWWSRMSVAGDWDRTTNQNGEQTEQEWEIFWNINGPMESFIRHGIVAREKVGLRHDDTSLAIEGNTDTFDELELRSWFEFNPTTNLWLGNFFKLGQNIDYTNNRESDVFVWEPNASWNVNTHLNARISYAYSEMEWGGDNVYKANLLDLRVTYQFSIRSFLRLSSVYYEVDRNLANFDSDFVDVDDVTKNYKSLATQLLYSYKLNPQTLFFLGYSEGGYQNDNLSKIRKDNRSVFMKLSYAWLL